MSYFNWDILKICSCNFLLFLWGLSGLVASSEWGLFCKSNHTSRDGRAHIWTESFNLLCIICVWMQFIFVKGAFVIKTPWLGSSHITCWCTVRGKTFSNTGTVHFLHNLSLKGLCRSFEDTGKAFMGDFAWVHLNPTVYLNGLWGSWLGNVKNLESIYSAIPNIHKFAKMLKCASETLKLLRRPSWLTEIQYWSWKDENKRIHLKMVKIRTVDSPTFCLVFKYFFTKEKRVRF